MNEQFVKRGGKIKIFNDFKLFLKFSIPGDNECILTILLFKRLINKSDLILKEVKEKVIEK
jgi:hypothetical protein